MTLRTGMNVWLKGSTMAMKVRNEIGPGLWTCNWFDKNSFQTGDFNESNLTDIDPTAVALEVGMEEK